MSKGENIFKRKDGRWEARYIKGYELSGKIKYGFCYGKTYREAKEKVTKCKAALVNARCAAAELEANSQHKLPTPFFILLRRMAAYAKVQGEGVYLH